MIATGLDLMLGSVVLLGIMFGYKAEEYRGLIDYLHRDHLGEALPKRFQLAYALWDRFYFTERPIITLVAVIAIITYHVGALMFELTALANDLSVGLYAFATVGGGFVAVAILIVLWALFFRLFDYLWNRVLSS